MNSQEPDKQALIIAAEESSCLYAQRLLELWRSQEKKIHCFGIGNRAMEALGFEILGRSEELAVTGIQEILAHYKKIKATYVSIVEEVKKRRPSFVLLMDYPGFNLKLAKELHPLGVKVIYYISPQLWAWKQGRVKIVEKYVDKMLVLLPFEVDFYKKHNVEAEFVGHPLLDEIDPKFFSESYIKESRQRFGFQDRDVVLGLMPGSRRKEIDLHLQTQLDVATRLKKKFGNIKLAMLLAPSVDPQVIKRNLGEFDLPIVMIQDEPFDMINVTDLLLVKSGTSTLMAGLLKKPMVIMYKFNWLTAWIAKLVVKGTRFFGLVNVIKQKEVVPERWQGGANVDDLTSLLARYLEEPEYREKVVRELSLLHQDLGKTGATERVAQVLDKYF